MLIVCKKCGETKDSELFYTIKASITGFRSECKACRIKYEKDYIKTSRGKEVRYKATRKYLFKHKYQLSLEGYNSLLEKQSNACLICFNKERLFVDHDHTTGKVRGLLCNGCNTGLGMFKENINALTNAINYIRSS